MPANRSRTTNWLRGLRQILERGGSIEIAVASAADSAAEAEHHLVWRVRVLRVAEDELLVEAPSALGQPIALSAGVALVAIMAIGQNRWRFETNVLGVTEAREAGPVALRAVRLALPDGVHRCQRRNHDRVETALALPHIEMWPLLDPRSVVLVERANELRFERDRAGSVPESAKGLIEADEERLMPEVGPKFAATLLNIGGGGIGVQVEPEHAHSLARHKVYWLRFSLPPELQTPICASAKLVHTHMQSDHRLYAGMAFDFTFNAGHQRFVVDQIRRFVAMQQQKQLDRDAA